MAISHHHISAISHHHISAISHHHISAISHHHISASSRPKIPQNRDTYQRRIADFAVASSISMPAKWHLSGDDFLSGKGSLTEELSVKHERKLKEARQVLEKIGRDTSEGLVMIDALQRLGIDYHFQNEIEAVLQSQYMNPGSFSHPEGNLYDVSTRFRLLRQEGFYVPTDVFNNFKDKEGRFRSELGADIRGLMGLYEASQLSTEGEDILVQAADFSSELLNGGIRNLDHYQAGVVRWTLQYPHHKSASRFMVQSLLGDFKGANGWANVLHELAKLDFSKTQSTYQNEIHRVSKWWKDTGLAKELRHARDQPLKWHMWSMAAFTNLSNSEERVELTKPIAFIYLIDDIFDVYGTLDELTLFTEAVNRWDLAAAEKLPHYIKICFKALDEVTNGIAYKVYRKHGWNPIDSLRKTWARLCNAFLVEAKWFASGQLPKAEEYLKNGIISSGVHVALVHMFFLLGHDINKHSVNLVDDNPGIITSTAAILRLWDDLGSAKDELQDGRDGSYVVCYMKDHRGTSVESARKQVIQMISDSWKRLNRECLRPNPYSAAFTKGCLNMARMVSLMYSYDDNQRLPILEDHMKSILSGSVSFEASRKNTSLH